MFSKFLSKDLIMKISKKPTTNWIKIVIKFVINPRYKIFELSYSCSLWLSVLNIYIITVSWATVCCQLCFTKRDSLRRFFYLDTVWMSSAMASTAGFTVIHRLYMRTNNSLSWTTHKQCSLWDTCSEPLGHYIMPSIKVATISSLSHHTHK